ncbi:unnamed protein product [Diplocarpon coronariae]
MDTAHEQNDLPRALPQLPASELASPSPQEEWNGPAPENLPHPPPPRTATTDMLRALSSLPKVREIPWKLGQELPPSKALDHERAQVRAAVMLSQRGKAAKEPCNRCARGTGRFSQCIHLDDWFQGACATCQMSSKGNLCSHRTSKEEATAAAQQKVKAVLKKTPLADTARVQQELSRKRKQVSVDKGPHKQHRKSYNIEDLESRFGAPLSRSTNSVPYEKSFDDDPAALLRYVYRQQQSQANGTKRHHHQQYNDESDEMQLQVSRSNGHSSGKARVSYTGGAAEGSFSPGLGNTVKGQQRSSLNENIPVDRWGNQDQREDHRPPVDSPVALIDSLPRKTQKQLYSIIGGLESGIRSQIQQTENLQKQLNLLKGTLGIDVEDGDL